MSNIIQVEPCTFEEVVKAQVCEDPWLKNMNPSFIMMYGKWFQDLKVNLLYLLNGCIKLNMVLMGVLKNIRIGSLLVDSLKRKEWTMTRYFETTLSLFRALVWEIEVFQVLLLPVAA